MSYYILKNKNFISATPGTQERTLFLLKKRDVPEDEQRMIVQLLCSSINRINSISKLLSYLTMNTGDSHHLIQPYILKKVSWNEAIDIFGFDYDSDTSDLENTSETERQSPI